MRISFERKLCGTPGFFLFAWRALIDPGDDRVIDEMLIPELCFDYLIVRRGRVAVSGTEVFFLPPQSLRGIFDRSVAIQFSEPTELFGARFSLDLALVYGCGQAANKFLPGNWIDEEVADLDTFAALVRKFVDGLDVTPQGRSLLQASHYSDRHKRRLSTATFGFPARKLSTVAKVQAFLAESCGFQQGKPHILNHLLVEDFYDQPHLNRTFQRVTGLSPLDYLQRVTILQDNLMSVSYNELPAESPKISI